MNITQVETLAYQILGAVTRFAGPVDRLSVIDVARNHNPGWRTEPAELRVSMQALDALIRADYLTVEATTSNITISPAGQEAVSTITEPEFHFRGDWLSEWIQAEDLREAFDIRGRIEANTFTELHLENWRQFSKINISFHPKLTILTGANAAGKTTLLNLLAPHFNWQAQLLVGKTSRQPASQGGAVGFLAYSNGGRSELIQPVGSGVRNTPLGLPLLQQVPGIFISSHRSISSYQPLAALPPRFSEADTIFTQFSSELQARYSGGNTQFSPLYRMKEALIAAAMYAYGSQALRADNAAREVWEEYQAVLKLLLPASLGFERLMVDDAELILDTKTEVFPLEAVSGGISAMLELSWQIFLRRRSQESFTVCIDEPENHLHPELQRAIMPSLINAFPDVSFVVATHSPFVVTSAQDAFVYALSRERSDTGVSSRRIESVNFSATPDETLMSVLGLDTSLPLWAEEQVNQLLGSLGDNPTADDLRRLRDGLRELGLDRQFPAAVRAISSDETAK